MQCVICGNSRSNKVEGGIYWCIACHRFFDKKGEIIYTSEGKAYRIPAKVSNLDDEALNKKVRINKDKIADLLDGKVLINISGCTGIRARALSYLKNKKLKKTSLRNIKLLADYFDISEEDLIV